MSAGRSFSCDRERWLPAVVSTLLLIGLTAVTFFHPLMRTYEDLLSLLFFSLMLLFMPSFVILVSMFYAANSFLDGKEERLMARVILILSVFSIVLSIVHALMMFGMVCRHVYTVAEGLAHVGILLGASLPPVTYAISVFLLRKRWWQLTYEVVLLSLDIVLMVILLPSTL